MTDKPISEAVAATDITRGGTTASGEAGTVANNPPVPTLAENLAALDRDA